MAAVSRRARPTSSRATPCARAIRSRSRAPRWRSAAASCAPISLLRRIKPAAVVGFGGYPTLPPVGAATVLKIPTIIHEQNAVMGRANRQLAPRVTAIATSFDGVLDARAGAGGQGDAHRQSGAAGGDRGGGDAVRRARGGWPRAPPGVRRQPGRAHHVGDRAGGDRAARRRRCARGCCSRSRRATRISRACATSMRG